jgi:hypothetical protein
MQIQRFYRGFLRFGRYAPQRQLCYNKQVRHRETSLGEEMDLADSHSKPKCPRAGQRNQSLSGPIRDTESKSYTRLTTAESLLPFTF